MEVAMFSLTAQTLQVASPAPVLTDSPETDTTVQVNHWIIVELQLSHWIIDVFYVIGVAVGALGASNLCQMVENVIHTQAKWTYWNDDFNGSIMQLLSKRLPRRLYRRHCPSCLMFVFIFCARNFLSRRIMNEKLHGTRNVASDVPMTKTPFTRWS